MVITMGFYKLSHGKFHHDRGNSDIDIMECCTPEHSVTRITWQLAITLFYYPDWVE